MFRDPRTSWCGLICVAIVAALAIGKMSDQTAIILIGLFAAGIGLAAKDGDKK